MSWLWPIVLDVARLVANTHGQYWMVTICTLSSPGSSLSSPGKAPKQLSLARALAVEKDTQLRQALQEDRIVKVVFINASDSVQSKRKQQGYEQMKLYREALQLSETNITILSLQSLVCSFVGLFWEDFLRSEAPRAPSEAELKAGRAVKKRKKKYSFFARNNQIEKSDWLWRYEATFR